MAYSQKFRDQHDDLIVRSHEISKYLIEADLIKDASLIRDMVSGLLTQIDIHITVEDKALYPQLMSCGNEEVAATAKQYQEEMGDISDFVVKYGGNWTSALAISENPKEFIRETNTLISALGKRIQKENNHLYKLADDFL